MKRGLALNYIEASGFSQAACSVIPRDDNALWS